MQAETPADPGRPPRAGACVVCDAPVPAAVLPMAVPFGVGARGSTAVVCRRPACRARVFALRPATHCTACGRLVSTAWERVRGVCESAVCLTLVREREYARQAVAQHAALVGAARAWRDRAAAAAGDSADALPVMLIPSVHARAFPMRILPAAPPPVVRLPRRRVRAFRAHLRRIATTPVVEAPVAPAGGISSVTSTPPPVITADEGALLGAACAACGGRCCRHGGDAAYLTPATLRRWTADRPGARPADAVAAYAAHLPAASVRGSCVYHTTAGCALPRALRSDTCNRFLCDGLHDFRQLYAERAAAGRPVRRAFVAVNELGQITRGQLTDVIPTLAAPTEAAPLSRCTPAAR